MRQNLHGARTYMCARAQRAHPIFFEKPRPVLACVRACVRACSLACVPRARVCVCVRACVHACARGAWLTSSAGARNPGARALTPAARGKRDESREGKGGERKSARRVPSSLVSVPEQGDEDQEDHHPPTHTDHNHRHCSHAPMRSLRCWASMTASLLPQGKWGKLKATVW